MKRTFVLIGLATLLAACGGPDANYSDVTKGYFTYMKQAETVPTDFVALRSLFRDRLQQQVTNTNFVSTRNFYTALDSARTGVEPALYLECMNRTLLGNWMYGLEGRLRELKGERNEFQYRKAYDELKTNADCLGPFIDAQDRQAGLPGDVRAGFDDAVRALSTFPADTGKAVDSMYAMQADSIRTALGKACLAANYYFLSAFETAGKTDPAKCARLEFIRGEIIDPVFGLMDADSLRSAFGHAFYAPCGVFDTRAVRDVMRRAWPDYAFLAPPEKDGQGDE